MEEDPLKELKEFSQDLIALGQEIGEKLSRKQALGQEIVEKEAVAKKLQGELFSAKTELAKLDVDLVRLEAKRRDIEKKQNKNF